MLELTPKIVGGLVIALLSGSLPFGYWLGRLHGIDIRQHGSGNIGSTNVARILGRKWGVVVFVLDFLKGWGPVFLMGIFVEGLPNATWWRVLSAAVAVMAHNYTPWLRFQGGKGIATSAGVLLALMPPVLAISLATWLVLTGVTRTVSIGSVGACLAVLFSALFFYSGERPLIGLAWVVCLMGVWRHRSNLQRLMKGTEPKLGGEKSS